MWVHNILAGCFFLTAVIADQIHNAVETEMFAIPISPNLFNWTYQGLCTYLFDDRTNMTTN